MTSSNAAEKVARLSSDWRSGRSSIGIGAIARVFYFYFWGA
jgi:hypothetical protein